MGMQTERLWAIHPHPKPDELLSSWLYRLAHARGLRVHTFCEAALGKKTQIWNRDIDRCAPPTLLSHLAASTGLSEASVFATTLRSYEGLLFERHNEKGNNKWILPLGIYHRTRSGYGQQFCPLCLFFDAEPYYRRLWRLSFATICPDHGCLLHDRCHACGAPVVFFRGDIGRGRPLLHEGAVHCWRCGADLRRAPAIQPDCFEWKPIVSLRSLLTFANDGVAVAVDQLHWYAHLFLDVLYEVAELLVHGHRSAVRSRLLTEIRKEIPLPPPSEAHLIDALDVKTRHSMLLASIWLLSEWPDRFIRLCAAAKVKRTQLLRDFDEVPYWFQDVLETQLNGKWTSRSAAEVAHAADYLVARGEQPSVQKLNRLMGAYTARQASDAWRRAGARPMEEPEVRQLLEALTIRIGSLEKGSMRRLILERDRVMFELLAITGWSVDHVVRLTTTEAVLSAKDAKTDGPNGKRRRWLLLSYLRDVRPGLVRERAEKANAFFLGAFGEGIDRPAWGDRFRRALDLAGLPRKGLTLVSLEAYGVGHEHMV